MNLFAYILSGTPINEYNTYEVSDLESNSPYTASTESSLSGYQDVSSIENWWDYGELTELNYLEMRDEINTLFQQTSFSSLNSREKEIVSKLFLTTKENIDLTISLTQQRNYAQKLSEYTAIVNQVDIFVDSIIEGDYSIIKPITNILFGEDKNYDSDEDVSSNASTNYSQKLRLTTNSLIGGNYRIEWYCEVTNTGIGWFGTGDVNLRVQIDDTTTICEEEKSPPASGVYTSAQGFYEGSISSGVHNIDLDFAKSGNGTASIRRARLTIWKIS